MAASDLAVIFSLGKNTNNENVTFSIKLKITTNLEHILGIMLS